MATESSAIARLVDAAQRGGVPGPDRVFDPTDLHSAQGPGQPPQKKSGGPWWLLIVGILVIGGSVAGGYLLAQQQTGDDPQLAEIGALDSGVSAAVVEATTLPPVPVAANPPASDAREEVEQELEPALGAAELALASETGFDILVEPKGAKITLDGHAIGTAPLRVRNLLPGVHQIDIEGPEGYFGQHQEFDLAAGEAMVLRLSLDALEAGTAKSEETRAQTQSREKTSRKRKPKEKRSRRPSENEEKALAGAGEVSLGTLMLGAKPPCKIFINGKATGLTTPQRSIQLPEGTHRVELVNEDLGLRKKFKVRIKPGRTTRAIQDLTKKL